MEQHTYTGIIGCLSVTGMHALAVGRGSRHLINVIVVLQTVQLEERVTHDLY